jgi:adenylate cyclase
MERRGPGARAVSIRLKIVLIVVPLVVAALVLTGVSSYFAASNGITRVARDFLGFKAQELEGQAQSQWQLLVENGFTGRPEMVAATQSAVAAYAQSIIRSPTELIFAVRADGTVAMATADVAWRPGEQGAAAAAAAARSTALQSMSVGGVSRVANGFWFAPFGWYAMVSEERAAFYGPVTQIAVRTGIILAASILAAVALVLAFARYLTRPLTRVALTMREIISSGDLSRRVVVEYRDETGSLAQTFNIMAGGLEEAYRRMKSYALKAAVSRTRERKMKEVFQQYVPPTVIEQVVKNEAKVGGDEDIVSVMFSHITNYAEIAAGLEPRELVMSLEPYFKAMVEAVYERGGIPDKYITDAVMAFFGAPVKGDDALKSVLAGLDMTEALTAVNARRVKAGKRPFHVSVGINRGYVTVGTIGTEQKMDYTVIGDPVNLASRLSGLTRIYRQDLLFSESLHRSVSDQVPCRLVDSVAVKGRREGVKIFTAKRAVSGNEKQAWDMHNAAMEEYYNRNFGNAIALFGHVLKILPGDYPAGLIMQRCRLYQQEPPPPGWDGVEAMRTK